MFLVIWITNFLHKVILFVTKTFLLIIEPFLQPSRNLANLKHHPLTLN